MAISTHSLRHRLRAETETIHKALEQKVSGFDVARAEGLGGYLHMQFVALGRLEGARVSAHALNMIDDLRDRARADLDRLGIAAHEGAVMPAVTAFVASRVHPLAIEYVVAGSRLGNAVLTKRWRNGSAHGAGAASDYFTASDHLDAWKSFVRQAEAMPASGDMADAVVRDAADVFLLFSHCADDVLNRKATELA